MKKFFTVVFLAVILIICFSALGSYLTKYYENKEKNRFIQTASSYLEQKYGIKITDCTHYSEGDIGYHSPSIPLDGGYFSYAPRYVELVDSTGKKITCIDRNGNLSDDYELDKLYKNFYDYLSDELGVSVQLVTFDNCGQETVYNNYNNHYVNKNESLFLERSTKRYANMDAKIFFNDLLGYFDGGSMNIYALENDGITQEQLMQNTELFKNGTDLDGVYVHMYDKDKDFNIRYSTMYTAYSESDYMYNDKYYVICNETGTRIQVNEK